MGQYSPFIPQEMWECMHQIAQECAGYFVKSESESNLPHCKTSIHSKVNKGRSSGVSPFGNLRYASENHSTNLARRYGQTRLFSLSQNLVHSRKLTVRHCSKGNWSKLCNDSWFFFSPLSGVMSCTQAKKLCTYFQA